jgi:hypothetical protein
MRNPVASATLLVALLAASVAPRVAQAQFGSFIKRKIAEKAVEKAAEKIEQKTATTDSASAKDSGAANGTAGRRGRAGRFMMAQPMDATALGSELTADTLERVLSGLDAVAARLRESEAARSRVSEVERKLADLRTSHATEVDAFRQREGKVLACQDVEFRRISRERSSEVDRRMKADPNFREHAAAAWQKYMASATDAQRRGDSATVVRLQLEMYRQILGVDFDARKDTVAAVRKCGAVPPKLAVLVLDDSLSRLSSQLNERFRELERDAASEGPARSGLTEQQFARARERIERWYVVNAKGGAHFWTEREDALLEAQRARIASIMRVFGVQG